MAEKIELQECTFEIPAELMEQFKAKLTHDVPINKNTGKPATESEMVTALMKFYLNGDIVII